MAKFTRLINGVLRTYEDSGAPIYDMSLAVVESSPSTGEIVGPIPAGQDISLPNNETYVGDELEVYLNGQRLEEIIDVQYASTTEIKLTFELIVGDRLRFRKDRLASE